jgi:xanthine/uracil permease
VVEGLGQFAGDRPMLNAVASSFKIVLQSGLAVGALTATVMNLILPDP